jgi:hypothetical protein
MRLIAITMLLLVPAFAQDNQDNKEKRAPRPPQNLKVLKIENPREIGPIMRGFTTGLGVKCDYCHVQGNFASDDKPQKETARHMIEMVDHINAGFPDGKAHVSCYTCHRGETEPKMAPEAKTAQ